ncbi:hypothetical protein LUZ63_007740 [Rhynchospora breviuscula]|uniref:Uncharacterized protein n=1 Tax=Rhynchospora breviuscula TaxID=2022672 RepID=A0A9Q0CSL7_9POAL|nr:hypothetical protein LUZ63_007740 [Rhynchospora breviuscula]
MQTEIKKKIEKMQNYYKFNHVQCPGPHRLYMLRPHHIPSIVNSRYPCSTPPYTARYLNCNKRSFSDARLASCKNDDHYATIGRNSANYEPSVWGDFFATYAPPNLETKERLEQMINGKKEEVRDMLRSSTNAVQLMKLVDTIQRLGIGYHFDKEINDALCYLCDSNFDTEDLQHVALQFRLLRQHGFNTSSDVFYKFKDSNGNFDEKLCKDARGLLSLCNAGYLAFPEETILDEAISFARCRLKSKANDLNSPLKKQVLRALKTPLHRMLPRIEAMYHIQEYEEEETRNNALLKLAKMDYNLVQRLHLEELKHLSLWYKELDLSEILRYARDRLVELYFWSLAGYFEPHYTRARVMYTKYGVVATVVDDTFDIYATYEESKLLNDAFQRWDEKAIDCLPMYLKNLYLTVINTVHGLGDELQPSEKYRIPYYIKETQILVEGYMQEIEWYAKRQAPTFDKRKKPAIDGNIGSVLLCPLLGMGEDVTEEALHWLSSFPDIVMAPMEICRYTDDVISYEREMNAGQGPTTIVCYMMEHNLSKNEAAAKFESLADESWKKLNQACLRPTNVPAEIYERLMKEFVDQWMPIDWDIVPLQMMAAPLGLQGSVSIEVA